MIKIKLEKIFFFQKGYFVMNLNKKILIPTYQEN